MTEVSSERAVDLARRLRAVGAKMYGAFWCSHCFEQKQAFGEAAGHDLPYVECYPEGFYKVGACLGRAVSCQDPISNGQRRMAKGRGWQGAVVGCRDSQIVWDCWCLRAFIEVSHISLSGEGGHANSLQDWPACESSWHVGLPM